MLVYNQKYRTLLSASLHGVIPQGQQTRPSSWFESVEPDKLFLFAFETNGRNFESTVIFFYNSNVILKYIFKYLCCYDMNQTLGIL